MKWYPDLYTGASLNGKDKKIIWLIRHGKPVPGVCLITLSTGLKNQLEIIPAREVVQSWYPSSGLRIIGIAGNRGEAIDMVTGLLEEAYAATGKADIPFYLRRKWEEQK